MKSQTSKIMLGVIICGLILILFSTPAFADPGWWNSSWNYRKPINISNTAGNLTNYQVKIVHNFSAEYSAGKINTTCNDIRFTY